MTGSDVTSSVSSIASRRLALDDLRPARVAELLRVGHELVANELREFRGALQRLLEQLLLLRELFLLTADLHFLELREMAQLGLEDRLGLQVAELEALHQHRLRLVLAPHDADHLVEVQERDQQAVEDVQPRRDLLEPVTQPALHGLLAVAEPLGQEILAVPARADGRRAR